MSTLRDDVLPIVDDGRALVADLGFRQDTATIRIRAWSGRPGVSTPTDTDLPLLPNPNMRTLGGGEVANSGGRYIEQDMRVGPITPAYAGGGYTVNQLNPSAAAGTEVFLVVTGPDAGEYTIIDVFRESDLTYSLTARRRRTTP